MRRDLCYYYPLPVPQVFEAFVQAANQKFGKNCRVDPCKTINFGLNFSFKYNMNGGSLTVHFMPYQNGTAVDLRYTIVQAMGARYKAHARDFILFINGILKSQGQQIQLDIKLFLDYEASAPSAAPDESPMTAQQSQTPPQPAQQFAGQPAVQQSVGQYAQPQSQPAQDYESKKAPRASNEAVPLHELNMKPYPQEQYAPYAVPAATPVAYPEAPEQPVQEDVAPQAPEEDAALDYTAQQFDDRTVVIETPQPADEEPEQAKEAEQYEAPAQPQEAQPEPPQVEQPQPAPVPVKRFCTYCGAKLVENALFCSVCGNRVR